jgi:asparagine synthase (glutamine-hydrolysing)
MPQNILNRMSKLGFETPEEVWMRENPEVFRNMVNDSIKYSNGIINESALTLFDNIINGTEKFSFQLWRIISFGRWMQIYNIRTVN